jgi:hypothetical protein
MEQEERQAVIDGEHLRILSICYLVSAAITAFFSLFGLLYAFIGVFLMSAGDRLARQSNQPPPPFVGLIFGLLGFGFFTAMIVLAILKFIVAKRLKERRSRVLCLVVAAISCLGIPFGTVLGIFTFLVLSRPSIMGSFDTGDFSSATVSAGRLDDRPDR